MALPGGLAEKLTAGLGKLPAAAGDPAAPDAGGDDMQAIYDDADKLVPGLGDLLSELVERIQSKDEEQDATELGG